MFSLTKNKSRDDVNSDALSEFQVDFHTAGNGKKMAAYKEVKTIENLENC